MYDGELIARVTAMGVGIHRRRLAVGCPASVCHANMAVKGLVHFDLCLLIDKFSEGCNLSHLFKQKNFRIVVAVAIDSQS